MIKILKPASRLIIVFILTMIVSGGILTYLSINSISNFKELTEKKITEEQLSIASKLSENFQQKLEDAAGNFTEMVMKENEADLDQIKHCDTLGFIENPFIINRTNGFLWPWFFENQGISSEVISSAAFMQDLRRAEMKEFRERNYSSAAYYYKLARGHATGKNDSARSVNGLARVYFKMGNNENAFSHYSVITSDFYSIVDYNGFPYVYYAILNILELSDSTNTSAVLQELEAFLGRLVNGTIPLNSSTADILTRISSRVHELSDSTEKQTIELDENIRIIECRLRFIDEYGKIIRASIEEEAGLNNTARLGRYITMNGISGDPGNLLLLDTDHESPVGFCIDLDRVWSHIIGINYCEYTEFEYKIDLDRQKED